MNSKSSVSPLTLCRSCGKFSQKTKKCLIPRQPCQKSRRTSSRTTSQSNRIQTRKIVSPTKIEILPEKLYQQPNQYLLVQVKTRSHKKINNLQKKIEKLKKQMTDLAYNQECLNAYTSRDTSTNMPIQAQNHKSHRSVLQKQISQSIIEIEHHQILTNSGQINLSEQKQLNIKKNKKRQIGKFTNTKSDIKQVCLKDIKQPIKYYSYPPNQKQNHNKDNLMKKNSYSNIESVNLSYSYSHLSHQPVHYKSKLQLQSKHQQFSGIQIPNQQQQIQEQDEMLLSIKSSQYQILHPVSINTNQRLSPKFRKPNKIQKTHH